jgi:hypothetical protein
MTMTLPSLISRGLSLLIAAAYLITAYFELGFQFDLYIIGGVLLLPLSFIWFPEHWGEYMGPLGHGHATCGTPAPLVAAGGWFLLVGLPAVIWIVSNRA